MKYYKNIHGQLLGFLDDGTQDYLILDTYVLATQAEIDQVFPLPTAQQQRDAIQAQIDALEQKAIENRKWREYSIEQMEAAAVSYGAAQVPPLDAATSLAYAYATNIAYKKTKDLDVQIIALRTQKDAIV